MFSILGYDFADKGYFINLPQSSDRLSNVEKLIKKYRINNLHRFEALTDELHVFSCTKSHMGVFKDAKENNLSTIFVAEDDFNIEDTCYYPTGRIQFLNSLIEVHEDLKNTNWDVLLFGCNPKEKLIKVTDSLYEVPNSTGAWAYLIKSNAYNYILENLNYRKDYIAIDDYLPLLNKKGFKTLMTVPLLINHSVGFVSTLQPRGPVNYDLWIQGNYHNHVYDTNEFKIKRVDPNKTNKNIRKIFEQ
jgi:GR25 family glycosyltransferase involved in LPS biosynthesis